MTYAVANMHAGMHAGSPWRPSVDAVHRQQPCTTVRLHDSGPWWSGGLWWSWSWSWCTPSGAVSRPVQTVQQTWLPKPKGAGGVCTMDVDVDVGAHNSERTSVRWVWACEEILTTRSHLDLTSLPTPQLQQQQYDGRVYRWRRGADGLGAPLTPSGDSIRTAMRTAIQVDMVHIVVTWTWT